MQYKVIPFLGEAKSSSKPEEVSRQLQALITQHATDGWEFHQLASVDIAIRPGCIAALLGSKVQYVQYDQVIFRR